MIRLLLFDLNGTAYDDIELAYGSAVETFDAYGLAPPTKEQFRQEITARYTDFYYKYGFKENFSGRGVRGDADEFNKIRKEYYEKNERMAHLRYDLPQVLINLRLAKIKIGIVSAEVSSAIATLLKKGGLVDLIGLDNIWGDAYGDKTPVLLEACRKMGVAPGDALYVDDTVDGLSSAVRAGIGPVGFGRGYNSPERLKTVTPFVIYEFSQLPGLINFLNNPVCLT